MEIKPRISVCTFSHKIASESPLRVCIEMSLFFSTRSSISTFCLSRRTSATDCFLVFLRFGSAPCLRRSSPILLCLRISFCWFSSTMFRSVQRSLSLNSYSSFAQWWRGVSLLESDLLGSAPRFSRRNLM